MSRKGSRRWTGEVALAVLCLLAGSRWLIEGAYPGLASTLLSQGEACTVAAAVWGFVALRSRPKARASRSGWAAGGIMLVLCAAVLGLALAGEHLRGNDVSLALMLAPLVIAVANAAGGREPNENVTGGLWPGLAALAGLLLILPEPSFQGMRPWVGLAAVPLLAGVGAVLSEQERSRNGRDILAAAPWAWSAGCAAAGVVFFVAALRAPMPAVNWVDAFGSCVLDATLLLLTLQSLGRLGASRWSAQFLCVPLVALSESLLVLRPALALRSWIGLGLLVVGATRQLVRPAPEAFPGITASKSAPYG